MRFRRVVPTLLAVALASVQASATGRQTATVELAQVDSLLQQFVGTNG